MDTITSILITIVAGVFELASWCFEIFVNLSRIPVISSDKYQVLIQNLYILVGIVVLFFISFSILKVMVDPGKTESETKDSSNVLMKVVTSIVLLIFVPTIFNFAFEVQNSIINYNTIGKLFGNSSTFSNNSDSEDFIKNAGNTLSNQIFMAFFTPNEAFCEEKEEDDPAVCAGLIESGNFLGKKSTLAEAYSSVDSGGSFMIYNDFGKQVGDDEIAFNFLVSLIAGGFLCYVIISFCFDLAIRMVKLIFMQLIAPLPIMLRIAPNSKMSSVFNQWLKICGSCYLEVFVRLVAIYFCLYLVTLVPDIISEINGGFMMTAFLYLGLIAFMRQIPNLLKDIFGIDSSSLKLGIRDKLAAGGLFAASAAAGSFATRLGRDAISNFKKFKNNGGFRGIKNNGFKQNLLGTMKAGSNLISSFGAAYGGLKSGASAKSFADVKRAAKTANDAIEEKRHNKEMEKLAYDRQDKKYYEGKRDDAILAAKQWFGIDTGAVVTEEEANRFAQAARAFTSAHDQAEGVFKGKTPHNNLKDKIGELEGKKVHFEKELFENSNLANGIAEKFGASNIIYNKDTRKVGFNDSNGNYKEISLREIMNDISNDNINDQTLLEIKTNSKYKDIFSGLDKIYDETDQLNTAKEVFEVGEMRKKVAIQMEAINSASAARKEFSDIYDQVITPDAQFIKNFITKKDSNGNIVTDEYAAAIYEKFKKNETIDLNDLANVDLKKMEEFMDKLSIEFNNAASTAKVNATKSNNGGDSGSGGNSN